MEANGCVLMSAFEAVEIVEIPEYVSGIHSVIELV